ncbi:MAG TPA: type I-F CRISPR-associated protein Csy2 [Castellaniella sp.]|uniref:type I-F CRISPR-associated protein Csy2 n=1 Tax=Castellaniella sp. TaxID=1955812 RepID=UPI002F234C2D
MSLMNAEPGALLILPHLRIQNANAISSPLTHGFPSMTAFLGFMWALGRRMAVEQIPLRPRKIGVICHWHQEQVQDGYVKTFRLTRNPVDRDGDTAAIVEEGRIGLEVTLVLQVDDATRVGETSILFQGNESQYRDIAWQVRELVDTLRIAGGTVLPRRPGPGIHVAPSLILWPTSESDRQQNFRHLRREWLPGFALVSRDDLLQSRVRQLQRDDPSATLLDAWLDLSRFNYRSRQNESGKIIWGHDRPAGSGWIVPIPVGYGALSDLHEGNQVVNARDDHTPFRFVESVYSIGQWIGPHRLRSVRDLLWWGEYRSQEGVYRCCNGYVPVPTDDDDEDPPGFSSYTPFSPAAV